MRTFVIWRWRRRGRGAALRRPIPRKTVRLISGVTPGSASDTMARILAEKLSTTLGQPVIVENRLGAGGLVGAKWVATQEPDGHTIMMYASAFTVSTLLNPGLDPKELAPVATVATIPTVLITPPGRYKTRAGPRRRRQGAARQAELRDRRIRQRDPHGARALAGRGRLRGAEHPYQGRGRGAHRGDLRPRRLLLRAGVPGAEDEGLGQGRRAPGERAQAHLAHADLPTTVEAGYPNSDYNFWVGTLVAAKTPRPIVERLAKEINALVQSPEIPIASPSSAPIRSRCRSPSSRR